MDTHTRNSGTNDMGCRRNFESPLKGHDVSSYVRKNVNFKIWPPVRGSSGLDHCGLSNKKVPFGNRHLDACKHVGLDNGLLVNCLEVEKSTVVAVCKHKASSPDVSYLSLDYLERHADGPYFME